MMEGIGEARASRGSVFYEKILRSQLTIFAIEYAFISAYCAYVCTYVLCLDADLRVI